jgi:hypothetical protein
MCLAPIILHSIAEPSAMNEHILAAARRACDRSRGDQPCASAAAAAPRPVRTAPSMYPHTHWSEPQT